MNIRRDGGPEDAITMMVLDQWIEHNLSRPSACCNQRYLGIEPQHSLENARNATDLLPRRGCLFRAMQPHLSLAVIAHAACLENRWQASRFDSLLQILQAIDRRKRRGADTAVLEEALLRQAVLRNADRTRIRIEVQPLQHSGIDVLALD